MTTPTTPGSAATPAPAGAAGLLPPAPTPTPRNAKLIRAAAPLLPPGTQIRQIIAAQTLKPSVAVGLMFLGILPGALLGIAINRNRLLAVANEGIYVLDCGHGSIRRPKKVVTVLPRATQLTPKLEIGGKPLHLVARWNDQIAAANAEAAWFAAPPAEG